MATSKRTNVSGPSSIDGQEIKVSRATPMNFDAVADKTRSMNDPEVVIRFDSTVAETSALLVPDWHAVTAALGLGTTKAIYLDIHIMDDIPNAYGGVPSLKKSSASLSVRWVEDGSRARIQMRKFLARTGFHIPNGTRAHIPVTTGYLKDAEADGSKSPTPCLIFDFGDVRFEKIEEGKRKKSSTTQAAAQAKTAETKAEAAPEAKARDKAQPADKPSAPKPAKGQESKAG